MAAYWAFLTALMMADYWVIQKARRRGSQRAQMMALHLVEMMVFRMDSDWATRRGHQMVQQRAVVIQMELN